MLNGGVMIAQVGWHGRADRNADRVHRVARRSDGHGQRGPGHDSEAATRIDGPAWPIQRRPTRVTSATASAAASEATTTAATVASDAGVPSPAYLTAVRIAEQGGQRERDGDEVAEPGAVQQEDRAEAQVRGDAEGAEQVPGPIERLVPAEGAADELGAGADAVPQQAERPDQLVRLPSAPATGRPRARRTRRTARSWRTGGGRSGPRGWRLGCNRSCRWDAGEGWSPRPGSNRRPLPYQGSALPTELRGPASTASPASRVPAVSQDRPILGNHRSTLVNLCLDPRFAGRWWLFGWEAWWAGRESNPHSRRRLIYSQRSSPPAQPTHECAGAWCVAGGGR